MKYVTKDDDNFVYLFAETEVEISGVYIGNSVEQLIRYNRKSAKFTFNAISIDTDVLQNFILTCTMPKVCDNQGMSNAGYNQ